MSGFTIPNTPDSFNQNQAEPDSLDFQILGNQRSGVISGCAVTTNATAQKVTVASGEVLINGAYYPYAGGVVDLTAYSSLAFFDIIHARVSGSTVTCYAVAPATGSTNPRFPASGSGANQVNLEMAKYVVDRVAAENGGSLKDKSVQVIGVAYKPNVADVRETPAEIVIEELKKTGAKVTWSDDLVSKWMGESSAPLGGADIAVVVTLHSVTDPAAVLKSAPYVFDTTGKVKGAHSL